MSQRKMHIAALSLLILMAGIGVSRVQPAHADFYKYKDSSGAVCITNDKNAVPPRYRATMTVVRDETLEKKNQGVRKQAPQEMSPASQDNVIQTQAPAEEPTSRIDSLTRRYPWLKPLVIIAGIWVLFLIVAKSASLLPSPQLAKIIYLAFFLGVFVFGYKLYAESLVNSYLTIKTKVLAMFIKANERQAPETGERPAGSSLIEQPLKTE